MYRAISEMTTSPSLTSRITACLATLQAPDPRTFAASNIYRFAAMPGWADAWQSAIDAYNINQNPDTGARTDVITDGMILAAASNLWTSMASESREPAPNPTLPASAGGPDFVVE